jgi:hypothetical protein
MEDEDLAKLGKQIISTGLEWIVGYEKYFPGSLPRRAATC